MAIEIDDVGIRIIGNEVKGIQFYDDGRVLRQEIYLTAANVLNIGDTGGDGGGGGDVNQHTLDGGMHAGTLASWQAPQFLLRDGGRDVVGDLLFSSDYEARFRDSDLAIYSSVDGQLDLKADVEVEITAPTIDLVGNVDVSNGLDVTGTVAATMITGANVTSGANPGHTHIYSNIAAATSANWKTVVSDETGSGAWVFANTPTLVAPILGTPTSGTLTNCTGLPISTGVSGLGANVATFLATPSSANLAAAVTDETGSGALVFANTPTLVTPEIGVATGTSLDLGGTTLLASRSLTVDTGGAFNIVLASAAGDDFTVDTDKLVVEGDTGNVGIGTTGPTAKLQVASSTGGILSLMRDDTSVSGGNYIGRIQFYSNDTDLTNSNIAGYIRLASESSYASADPDGKLEFGTSDETGAASTKMVIDGSGNVGVNTTGPDRKLDVLDASNPQLRLTHTDGSVYAEFEVDGSGDLTIAPTGNDVILSGAHLTIPTTYCLYLRDAALKVYSSLDGQLDVDADTEIELTAPTIQLVASTKARVDGLLEVDGNLQFVGAQQITTTADGLVIAPAADLTLTPGGDDVILTWAAGKSLTSSDYASQTTGWGISYGSSGGHADFRSMYADELHVKAFIADIYQALIGGIVVTKSRARLSRDFTIPANTLTGTLYVEDLEGWENTQLFAASDVVRLRYVDTSGGGLIVTDVWGVVTNYTDLVGGEQSYTFTTSDDGGVSASAIYAGAIALDYGQSGSGSQGIWEATVLDAAGAPYSQVATWATNPWTPANWTTRARLGNLDGISGVGLEYGLWAGQNATDTFLLLSDSSFEVHGLDIKLYDGASNTVRLDPATPSIALGATLPTDFAVNDGIWMGKDTVYKFRVGDIDGERFAWDGSDIYIYADNANYLKATGTGIEIYNDSVKMVDLVSAGILYLGDQSNEHIKLSSTSVQIKDGANVYTDLTAGTLTLGHQAGGEYVTVASTGIEMCSGGSKYVDLTTAGVLTLGYSAGAYADYILITTGGIEMYANAVQKVDIDSTGALWIGDSATTERLSWDSTNGVQIYNASNAAVVKFPTSGNAEINGTLLVTGTLATGVSPNTRIEMTSTLIAGYSDATTKEFYLQASDGKAYAGGGNVVLGTSGIRIETGTSLSNRLRFTTGGTEYAHLGTQRTVTYETEVSLEAWPSGSGDYGQVRLAGYSDSAKSSYGSLTVRGADTFYSSPYVALYNAYLFAGRGAWIGTSAPASLPDDDCLYVDNDIRAAGGLYVGSTSVDPLPGVVCIKNGTAPSSSITDGVQLYAEDVSSSSELKVRDEAGNVTTLSPHNFSLIPDGPSEEMAWSFYSERHGRRINVDMLRVVRLVEQLTDEQLVFLEGIEV